MVEGWGFGAFGRIGWVMFWWLVVVLLSAGDVEAGICGGWERMGFLLVVRVFFLQVAVGGASALAVAVEVGCR